MEYLEIYKLTFGWTLVICYNLVYWVGILTILKFLWNNYFNPMLSLIYDIIKKINCKRKKNK